jgi:DNA-binding MurR/RpiR family transcriptional regulator
MRLERRCSILDFAGGMAAQQVANLRPGDVLAAIAFTEYAAVAVDVVREAYPRGIRVVAITDTAVSPLARNATVALCIEDETTERFKPIAGPTGLVQTLIIALGVRAARQAGAEPPRARRG